MSHVVRVKTPGGVREVEIVDIVIEDPEAESVSGYPYVRDRGPSGRPSFFTRSSLSILQHDSPSSMSSLCSMRS